MLQASNSLLRTVRVTSDEVVCDSDNITVLSMGLTCGFGLRYRTEGTTIEVVPQAGRLGIVTPGQRFDIAIQGTGTFLQMLLPKRRLAEWLAEDHEVDADRVEIAWDYLVHDPVLSNLLCRAKSFGIEGEEECARAIAARLLERHASRPRLNISHQRGGLTGLQLRRVFARIEHGLSERILLEDLAKEAGLSPFHFTRQFTRSVGTSPYRYVLSRRLSRAVDLLAKSEIPIAMVAAQSGFAHVSHMSRYVRQAFGCAPAELRRSILL